MEQFIGLISKVSVVLVFIFTSVLIGERFGVNREKKQGKQPKWMKISNKYINQVLQGIMFSFLIVIEMLTSFLGPNGIRYDARVVLLNLSATYGPISGAITTLTGAMIRIIKGRNYPIAISSIFLVYMLELLFIYYEKKKGVKNYFTWIYLMSFLTNVMNGFYIMIVSAEEWEKAIIPAITYVVAYPLFTLIAYNIMCYIKSRDDLLRELSNRDTILQMKNEELSKINETLKENEFRLRQMFSNSGEAIILIEDFKISEVNLKALELLGYSDKNDVLGETLCKFIVGIKEEEKQGFSSLKEVVQKVKDGENIKAEVLIRTKDKNEMPLEVFMVDIKIPDAEYIYMSARDISARKQREGEILYKARHDALTTVANRQYFEEMLNELTMDDRNYPIAYMMADINGLKLVNDVFGHAEGDMLIVKIADTLTRCCRNGDIIARLGGDEFAILFTRADENALNSVMERVRTSLKKEKTETVEPSLSMGYAIKYKKNDGLTVDEMAKKADEMMYKNKIDNRKVNERTFLDNMVNRLYEQSPDDRVMAFELTKFLERIRKMKSCDGVTKREVSKLIRYVNIGKLATDISNWEILGEKVDELSFPKELLEASDAILTKISHSEDHIIGRKEILGLNERWDGSGEMKLSGKEIPKTIRVFKILFDVYYISKHEEKFGKLTEEEIFEHLEEFAGKKYDPSLLLEIKEEMHKNQLYANATMPQW